MLSGRYLEQLESRKLLAATISPTTPTTLLVDGTPGNDVIGMAIRGTQLRVVVNGVLQRFVAANINRIEIQAGEGNDVADWSGISINTYINAGAGNDSAVGGNGNDSLTGAAGKDTLRGGPGNDRIDGANSPDICYGDAGSDVLYGSAHDDYLDGGDGVDWCFGGDGADRLIGGLSNDRLYGGESGDRLYGMEGNDLLNGENGNDRVFGGVGDDQVYGGAGADSLYGELGDDSLFDKDSTADLIDGGDGTDNAEVDGSLDNVSNAEDVVGTVPPPIVSTHKVALSFNDEALWDSNFSTAVAQAKALGVTAVRVWLSVNSFAERPNAYDTVDYSEIVKTWVSSTSDRAVIGGLAMKRAFELRRAGFSVTLTVNNWSGDAPTSDAEVKALYTHLMNSPEKVGGTTLLRDVVDYWEVGQEVDSASNWKPTGVNKTTGLQSYVDDYLIPAADALHSGTVSKWEKVVSASVRYNPNDLYIILAELKKQNRLDAIDFAGFHPYGIYDPTNPTNNEIATRTTQAVAFGKQFGKKLIATEWNVRGFPTNGTKNTTWAQAIDDIYHDVILPNYEIGFYYALVNNFAGRGGNTTARPAGLLKHNTTLVVSPTSSIDDLVTYFKTPLVKSDPFYTEADGWVS